ncbi:trefoil factor 1 [Sciurus carolinensis]|uniref:trefoil factor 1 n=1 Tax=Sciurus carolinensis TaxID=30640 RepID=UPI001FB55FDD|nr:trefoil factor 1 [Sciurus carolinensis]
MGHKVTCVLLLVLMLTLSTLAGDQKESCEVAPSQRENCGFPGVTAEECEKKNCCFKAYPPGYPWCFHPLIPDNTTDRTDEEECAF